MAESKKFWRVLEHYADLGKDIEFNKVSFNSRDPIYDFRKWYETFEGERRPTKSGFVLTEAGARALYEALGRVLYPDAEDDADSADDDDGSYDADEYDDELSASIEDAVRRHRR